MVRVHVRTPLKPTESPERVRQAITNVFPGAQVMTDEAERRVVATAQGLERLGKLVRDHQIPDSARSAMLAGRVGSLTRFQLGKQAAYVGKPSFGSTDSPLGSLEVTVEAEDADALDRAIYEAAPDTTVAPELATVPPEQRPELD